MFSRNRCGMPCAVAIDSARTGEPVVLGGGELGGGANRVVSLGGDFHPPDPKGVTSEDEAGSP